MPGARVAVLVPWFKEARVPRLLRKEQKIRVFAHGWSREAALFQPEIIAATRQQLDALIANSTIGAHAGIPASALVLLTRPGAGLLDASERDRLWHVLRVPVYEQIIATDASLVAAECEAHNGLHLSRADLVITGYMVDSTACGCGRKTPRIIASTLASNAANARAASANSTV